MFAETMELNTFESTAVFLGIGIVSWLMVWGIRRIAEHHQLLDIPNHRSSHTRPVPRGGGGAIAVVCLAGAGLLWWRSAPNNALAAFTVGGLLVTLISLIDDVKQLSSATRFLTHAVAASLLLIACGCPENIAIPGLGNVAGNCFFYPLFFIWIVGLTNAYNFMDGIDGIAATQAIVAGIGWFLLGRTSDMPNIAMLGLLIAAGSAGFLVHNWSPAKIFMGDVGSAMLGYAFASLTLMATCSNPRMCVAGVLLVWPFVFDSAFTFWRRALRRENVFAAHRSHLYQRLVIAGWSHARTTILYTLFDLIGLGLAFAFVRYPCIGNWLVIIGLPAFAAILWLMTVHQERRCCSKI